MTLARFVSICSRDIVRLRLAATDQAPEQRYLDARQWPQVAGDVECQLQVGSDEQSTMFCDRAGHPLLKLESFDAGNDHGARVRLHLAGEQHFYGLGQGGSFDRLGAVRRLWNCHVNHASGSDIAIPLLVSNAGYGVFFDNSSLARIEPGDSDSTTWLDYACEQGSVDIYFLVGDGMRGTLEAAADLLGRAPMPPRWGLGYLQSTRHFESADELRRLPATFREKRLPCDAIILLSSYGEAMGWNRGVGWLDWHPRLAPDPGELIGELRAQRFHAITHEYPVVHPQSPLYAEAEAKGFLLDYAYPETPIEKRTPVTYMSGQRFIDFSQPDACAWWSAQHADLVRAGIQGWWLDGGEGPPAEALHNRYDLMRYRAFTQDASGSRRFLLSRSGGPGMQRFGAATWTGDVNGTFETLEAQIATGLNVGLSGVPYWGTDIGGYYPTVESSAELFVRWFQFGAFCPLFRAHGRAWREHLPWAHGSEIEAICRRYLDLRYRLAPYTYTLAWQAHCHGLPLMRPLVLNHASDARTWQLGTQYTWGDDLLVAPVTRGGATHWPVYLPGGRWYDFWTHDAHEGERSVSVEAPLDRLPLFVRAGAIIPMGPVMQHLDGPPADDITLLVYPEARSSFTLYEDDGTTNAYLGGVYALTDFECTASPSALVCRICAPRGADEVVPASRNYTFQIFAPAAPREVGLQTSSQAWWHDGEKFLFVRLGRGPAEIHIDW